MNAFAHIQQTIAFTLCAIAFTACTKDELVAPNATGQSFQGPGQAETRMLNNERDQFGRTDSDAQAPQDFPGDTRMLNDEREQFGRTDMHAKASQHLPGETRMLNNKRGHIGRSDGPTPPDFQDRPQIDLGEGTAHSSTASQHQLDMNEEVRRVLKPAEITPTSHRTSIGRAVDKKPMPVQGDERSGTWGEAQRRFDIGRQVDKKPMPHSGDVAESMPIILQEQEAMEADM